MLAFVSLLIWVYLVVAHGNFWKSGPQLAPALPAELPDVDIIVPARDEVETIHTAITSLLSQDYPGKFRVTLIDDNSTDGTAAHAGAAPNLIVISGRPKPSEWSGKLWALHQGIESSSAPILLFTDADVVHDRRHLSSLVARLLHPRVEMVSEMVRLNCQSAVERCLIPAFVYFFQMLYPFAKVNDSRSSTAAAAGGTVLIRRATLEAIGGIKVIKGALIDDVSLAKTVKTVGPIYLGHSGLASSIRRYSSCNAVWQMISRTAFTQLHYSGALLLLAIIGLALTFLAPAWGILFDHGWPLALSTAAFVLETASFIPTLARYGQNRLLAFTIPLVALFYMAATVGSAFNHWFGKGTIWKSRDYGAGAARGDE
jgi:hopene-associated glycosyltransferase HpnB